MSKNHQNHAHTEEYAVIKHDLIKVIILNSVYLVGVLVLYYFNRQNGFLENWFAKVFNF